MLINRDMEYDSGRMSYALALLESSGYEEARRSEIAFEISESTPDQIEIIIQDLLLNQVDNWNGFRLKDINRRLDRCS
jgi:hypothetical protein